MKKCNDNKPRKYLALAFPFAIVIWMLFFSARQSTTLRPIYDPQECIELLEEAEKANPSGCNLFLSGHDTVNLLKDIFRGTEKAKVTVNNGETETIYMSFDKNIMDPSSNQYIYARSKYLVSYKTDENGGITEGVFTIVK